MRDGVVHPVRRHGLFGVLLVAGAALRVLTSAAYRPAFLLNDSLYYLANAEDLSVAGNWPVGYSVLLRGLLAVGDLGTVAWAQHAAGLGIATGIYVLLLRADARPWVAALAAAPVLLDGYQLVIEHFLLAETLFDVLIFGSFALLTDRVGEGRRRSAAAAGAGLLLGLAVSVRLIGALLIVPMLGFLLLDPRAVRSRLAAAAACIAMFALPVTGMLVAFRAETGEVGLSPISGRMLYARTAPWVDCARLDPPGHERPLCPPEPLGERRSIEAYMWDRATPAWTYDPADVPDGSTVDDVLGTFARRAILAQPGDFVRAVAADMVKAFGPTRRQYEGDVNVARWQFQRTFPDTFRQRTFDAAFGDDPPLLEADPRLAGLLRAYQLSVGFTPGTLLGAALLVGLAGTLGRTPLRWTALPWVAAALIVLLAPTVYQLSWRYMLPALVLAPVAGAYGATSLWPRATRSAGRSGPRSRGGVARLIRQRFRPVGAPAGRAESRRAR